MKSNKPMTKQAPLIAAFLLFIGSCIIACGGSTHNNNNETEKEVEQTSWSLYGVTIKKIDNGLFQTSARLTPENTLKARRELFPDLQEVHFVMIPWTDKMLEYAIVKDSIEFYLSEREELDMIGNLKQQFKFTKDEFDSNGRTWVHHKKEPKIDRSAIYCYFATINDDAYNLRFVIRYYSSDWLFIDNYTINADGKIFNYSVNKIERDNTGGYIWEWSDELVKKSNIKMLESIAEAQTAKIKFNGNQYYDTYEITDKEKTQIKQTIKLYKILRGELYN